MLQKKIFDQGCVLKCFLSVLSTECGCYFKRIISCVKIVPERKSESKFGTNYDFNAWNKVLMNEKTKNEFKLYLCHHPTIFLVQMLFKNVYNRRDYIIQLYLEYNNS